MLSRARRSLPLSGPAGGPSAQPGPRARAFPRNVYLLGGGEGWAAGARRQPPQASGLTFPGEKSRKPGLLGDRVLTPDPGGFGCALHPGCARSGLEMGVETLARAGRGGCSVGSARWGQGWQECCPQAGMHGFLWFLEPSQTFPAPSPRQGPAQVLTWTQQPALPTGSAAVPTWVFNGCGRAML